MNGRYFFPSDSMCISSSNSSIIGDRTAITIIRDRPHHRSPPSYLTRLAMRVSRSRWFTFLRRVFHYQNTSRNDNLGSNPLNSSTWMALELVALLVQITMTTFTLAISKSERPVWPMRMWIVGYDIGCFLNLLLLFGRFRFLHLLDGLNLSEMEQQRGIEESRTTQLMNKCRTSLDLFFAIWFVMGNVWVFDSRFGSFHRAPKLHVLCLSLLAWNAITYSFPFLLFLLLCCCVPLISTIIGYNMNVGSADRGASEDQISQLPSWNYKALNTKSELGTTSSDCDLDNSFDDREDPECCICLAKYKDKEEVRQLPCSHMFHLKCVDQWLQIISSCPLCKQLLQI